MGNLPAFRLAIHRQGLTHDEQAKKIGIPPRTLTEYKRGRLPRVIKILLRNPELVEALLEDARNGHTNGNH